jgi:hypothetical protein
MLHAIGLQEVGAEIWALAPELQKQILQSVSQPQSGMLTIPYLASSLTLAKMSSSFRIFSTELSVNLLPGMP